VPVGASKDWSEKHMIQQKMRTLNVDETSMMFRRSEFIFSGHPSARLPSPANMENDTMRFHTRSTTD
jgi:hypothetical protein